MVLPMAMPLSPHTKSLTVRPVLLPPHTKPSPLTLLVMPLNSLADRTPRLASPTASIMISLLLQPTLPAAVSPSRSSAVHASFPLRPLTSERTLQSELQPDWVPFGIQLAMVLLVLPTLCRHHSEMTQVFSDKLHRLVLPTTATIT